MKIAVESKQGTYEILIENGALSRAAQLSAGNFSEVAIVTDSNVRPLYGEKLLAAFQAMGKKATLIEVPAGESSKDQQTLFFLYDRLLDAGITRTGGIIALGGGVVGDLAGFAAATFLRGVGLVQVPTTLLAQVDSSVGGKTAIDLPRGKNLGGAFYQPGMVIIDPLTLRTLPEREFYNGMAEVVKYAFIRDKELYALLKRLSPESLFPHLEEIIGRCCQTKRDYVQQDTFDKGARMELNFGHTIGHALELSSQGALLHGEAVSHGMAAETRLSVLKGVCGQETLKEVLDMLGQYRLLNTTPPPIDCALIGNDKKSAGETINVVMLRETGDACLFPMEKKELFQIISDGGLHGSNN